MKGLEDKTACTLYASCEGDTSLYSVPEQLGYQTAWCASVRINVMGELQTCVRNFDFRFRFPDQGRSFGCSEGGGGCHAPAAPVARQFEAFRWFGAVPDGDVNNINVFRESTTVVASSNSGEYLWANTPRGSHFNQNTSTAGV